MGRVKVSVVVPIYNVSNWLDDCLTSLENQTLTDIEVIMVNDGSTDNSGEIAARYAARNSNFTLVHRENGGLSAARNTGMDLAHGEFIYFLDSDDYISENALELLYTKAVNEDLEVIRFSAYSFDDGSDDFRWGPEHKYKGNYPAVIHGISSIAEVIHNGDYDPSCCLIFTRKETIQNNGLRFYEGIIHEDNLFNYQLMTVSRRTAIMNQPLYFRRVRAGSIMTTPNLTNKFRSWCIVLREAEAFNIPGGADDEAAKCKVLKLFTGLVRTSWESLSWEVRNASEQKKCLKEIKPVLKKYNHAVYMRIQLYLLSPILYKICKWSVSTIKRLLRREKV